jgi:hypothetical protein
MALSKAYAALYSSFLFFAVMVIALLFGGGGAFAVLQGGLWTTLRWVVSMIPYALLAWGLVMTVFTLNIGYMIPSTIGASSLVTCIISAFVFGKFLPMFVVSTAAILTYYTYDYTVQNAKETPVKNLIAIMSSVLVLLAQVLSTKASPPGTYLFTSSLYNDGLAALFGFSLGLSGWISTSASSPEYLPYTGQLAKSSSSSAPSSAPAADPSTTTPTPEQSELDKVKADIKYLNSVGITDPNSNETLKNLTAKQKQLESNLFDNVVPNITK